MRREPGAASAYFELADIFDAEPDEAMLRLANEVVKAQRKAAKEPTEKWVKRMAKSLSVFDD